jgi:DNA-binding GntR family transcriptional regulator
VGASAVDRIADELRQQIFDGELAPGAPLREVELAERHRAGRHTVRAALSSLVGDGLATRDPHRSARVRRLEAADVRDLFATRRLLELEAVRRLVAEDAPLAPLEQAVERRESVEAEAVALGAGYTLAEIDADLAFHRAIVHGSGSDRLGRMFELLANELRLAFVAYIDDGGDRGDHRAILEAVRARDAPGAAKLLDLHLRDGLRACLAACV